MHATVSGFQETQQTFSELALQPPTLAEMIALIESGTISGKIGKQILPDLLQVSPTHAMRDRGLYPQRRPVSFFYSLSPVRVPQREMVSAVI